MSHKERQEDALCAEQIAEEESADKNVEEIIREGDGVGTLQLSDCLEIGNIHIRYCVERKGQRKQPDSTKRIPNAII